MSEKPGDRFGRWTVLRAGAKKHYVDVVCDCGHRRDVYLYSLRSGRSQSCGCYHADVMKRIFEGSTVPEQVRAKISTKQKQRWKDGAYRLEEAKAAGAAMGKNHAGKPQTGGAGKGVRNTRSKWFALRSPHGVLIRGLNLYHLVRENAHLFERADIEPRNGKHGLETSCNAIQGLHKLFQSGENRRGSWKGWTPALDLGQEASQ